MNKDTLQYADLLELLIDGPAGGHRRWTAFPILRMLEISVSHLVWRRPDR